MSISLFIRKTFEKLQLRSFTVISWTTGAIFAVKNDSRSQNIILRRPGNEPQSTACKATMLTIIPPRLFYINECIKSMIQLPLDTLRRFIFFLNYVTWWPINTQGFNFIVFWLKEPPALIKYYLFEFTALAAEQLS